MGEGDNPKWLTLNSDKVVDFIQKFGSLVSFSVLFQIGFRHFLIKHLNHSFFFFFFFSGKIVTSLSYWLPIQNYLFKIIFTRTNFICQSIFKLFVVHF